jgi:hypothetical protein
MLRRITPAAAATAIADGLEARSSCVIRPALWRPLSALRGLIGPGLDARFATDRRILDVLARLDARGASALWQSAGQPASQRTTTLTKEDS